VKVFKRVYFRIQAGYVWGKGMPEHQNDIFRQELSQIFTPMNFTLKENTITSASDEYVRDNEYLYCHPMNLSGALIDQTIKEVTVKLEQAKSFKLKQVDIYNDICLYEEQELKSVLNSQKKELQAKLINAYKTKRKDSYRGLSECINIKERLANSLHCFNCQRGIVNDFIDNVFSDLIRQYKIIKIEKENITGYRTAKNQ